jgi:hypothetical protein
MRFKPSHAAIGILGQITPGSSADAEAQASNAKSSRQRSENYNVYIVKKLAPFEVKSADRRPAAAPRSGQNTKSAALLQRQT